MCGGNKHHRGNTEADLEA